MILLADAYYVNNYGSKLQSFATQAILDKMGVENKTIACERVNKYLNKRKLIYYVKNIQNFDAFWAQVMRSLFKLQIKKNRVLTEGISVRNAEMKRFTDTKIRFTRPYLFSKLGNMCEDYNVDMVIVGSDQLWLPSQIYADFYTLGWVPDRLKKISLATSLGVAKWDERTKNSARTFLSGFEAISVREDTGAGIIRELTSHDVKQICDPVLFFTKNEWKQLLNIKHVVSGQYIFCYFLGDNPWQRKWAKELSIITGMKIVTLPCMERYVKSDLDYAEETLYGISPEAFLGLIDGAAYVCTDSFHGTAFSVLFHRQFFVFKRFSDAHSASTNSRLESFLRMLDLEKRIVRKEDRAELIIKREIGYKDVDGRVEKMRRDSCEWLQSVVGGK